MNNTKRPRPTTYPSKKVKENLALYKTQKRHQVNNKIAMQRQTRTSINNASNNEQSIEKANSFFDRFILRTLIATFLLFGLIVNTKLNILPENININDKIQTNANIYPLFNWYESTFGDVIPISEQNDTMQVFSPLNTLLTKPFGNGVLVELDSFTPVQSFTDGLIIYIGDNDEYGKSVIVQTKDGNEYIYGNLESTNLSLYSRIYEGTIIGAAKVNPLSPQNNQLYLAIRKDGVYLNLSDVIPSA